MGLVGQRDTLGINDHQLGPLLQVLLQEELEREVRLVRIVAPEDVEIGVRFFSGIPPESHLPGADAHAIADALYGKEVW